MEQQQRGPQQCQMQAGGQGLLSRHGRIVQPGGSGLSNGSPRIAKLSNRSRQRAAAQAGADRLAGRRRQVGQLLGIGFEFVLRRVSLRVLVHAGRVRHVVRHRSLRGRLGLRRHDDDQNLESNGKRHLVLMVFASLLYEEIL